MVDVDIENLEETNDLATKLRDVFREVSEEVFGFNSQLSGAQRVALDLKKAFKEILSTSEELGKKFVNVNDVEKKILKDSRLFAQVEKEVYNLLEAQHKLRKEEILAVAKEEHKTLKDIKFELRLQNQHHRDLVAHVKNELELRKKKAELIKLESLSIGNIKNAIEDLGSKIRHPDKLFGAILGKAGDLPGKIFESAKGSKNLGETFSKLVGPALDKIKGFAKMLFSPAGLLIVGVAAAVAALVGLYALFKNFWEFMDKNVVPATAEFNKQIGATSEGASGLKSQMVATGVEFELLGRSFEEGAKLVRDFASAMRTSEQLDKQALQTGKELMGVLGLTGDEAGNLALQFTKQGKSLDDLNSTMNVGAAEAKAYGLPVNDVLRDIAKAPNVLARFGTANSKEFAKSAAKARSYGLEIEKVNQAFGKQLDSFEGSADAAAKLNTIFGTQINSFELMLETDPTKRMEMMRKELEKQGKSWEKLSVFERNVITQTTGVDEATAALMLSSEKERKELERKAATKKREIDVNEKWNRGITSIKTTLIAWGKEIDATMRSITELISAMFGWEKPGKNVAKTGKTLTQIFKDVREWLNKNAKAWRENTDELSPFMKVLKAVFNILGTGFKIIGKVTGFIWNLNKAIIGAIAKFADFFLEITGVKDALIKAFDYWVDYFAKVDTAIDEFFNMEIDWGLVWKGFKQSVIEVIDWLKENWQVIVDFIVSPFTKTFDIIGGGLEKIKGLLGEKKTVSDALITKTGKVIEFNPQDNILASKSPMLPNMATASFAGGFGTTEIKMLTDAIKQISTGPAARKEPEIKVEVIDVNLDGKKIGEAQVRISRY